MFASSKIIATLAITAAAISAGTASAGEFQSNGRTAQVYHGDLDLAQARQRQQLRARIARAASKVCASSDLAAMAACRAQAIAHVETPVSAAIARAETRERFAEADKAARPMVGN